MSYMVLIPEQISNAGIEYLKERGYIVDYDPSYTDEDIKRKIVDSDGILTRIYPFSKDILRYGKKIKVISKHGIGFDNIDVDYCTEKGIQVTYTPEVKSENVAEHALYLLLACAKNAYIITKEFRIGGDFEVRDKYLGMELIGKTIGIIGLGRIGRSLAKKCIGIGMKVIGYDPYANIEYMDKDIKVYENRDEVFKNADFISLNLPCTKDTKGTIDIKDFKLMKKSAIFINVARGGIIIEDDLIHALKSGIIRGAGIDVFEKEPVLPTNELLHLNNVVATPHYAGCTQESADEIAIHAAIGIDEVLSGKPVTWPVNKLKEVEFC
jgi:D-3-phosphoglycerate dehydrogenase